MIQIAIATFIDSGLQISAATVGLNSFRPLSRSVAQLKWQAGRNNAFTSLHNVLTSTQKVRSYHGPVIRAFRAGSTGNGNGRLVIYRALTYLKSFSVH